MGRRAQELGALQVGKLKTPGLHFVGGVDGLALAVAPGGSRSWRCLMETTLFVATEKQAERVRPASRPLPAEGFVRQSTLIPHIVPFSPATLWRKVKTKDFPAPVKLSSRITAWRVQDIREWLQRQE